MNTLKSTLAIASLILSASATTVHAGLFEDIADAMVIQEVPIPVPDFGESKVTDCFPEPPDFAETLEALRMLSRAPPHSTMGNVCLTQLGRSQPGPLKPIDSPCYISDPYGRQVWGIVGL